MQSSNATPLSSQGQTPSAPLVRAGETGWGLPRHSNVIYTTHPFARTRGPLVSSGISGGLWIQVLYVMSDIVLVLVDVIFASHLRLLWNRGFDWSLLEALNPFGFSTTSQHFGFVVLYAAVVALFCHTQGLYETARNRSRLAETFAVGKAVCFATVLLTATIYASGVLTLSRLVIWGSAVLNIVTLGAWRLWKRGIVERRVAAGIGTKNVLIVGAGKVGREVADYLDRNKQLGLVVKGFLDQSRTTNPRVLGKIEDLASVARAHFVDEIIITIPSMRQLMTRVLFEAKRNNLEIKIIPNLFSAYGRKATLQYMGGIPVMSLYREPVPVMARLAKRVLDVIGAIVGIAILSPLMVTIAVLIKCDSRGPVFYRCSRIGKKGKAFLFYKFRTMIPNADALKDSLRHLNEREKINFKIVNDPRTTRVGKVLRKYSLDELPQLWNVLVGDMSLVGPRPHPMDDYKQYALEHLRRLDITPGITGLWQVTARRDPSFDRSIALDVEYIENWSLWMDLRILLKTLPAVMLGEGA